MTNELHDLGEAPPGFLEAVGAIVEAEYLPGLDRARPELAEAWRAGAMSWDVEFRPDDPSISVLVRVFTADGVFKIATIDATRVGFTVDADGWEWRGA